MMHDSALHLTEDELHDAADGSSPSASAGRIERHLMHCARCRAEIERIRELLALAAALPRSIDPPADLWPDIRTRIRQQPVAAATSVAVSHRRWDAFTRDRRWLAAAVLLIAASSALTMMFTESRPDDLARGPDSIAPVAGPPGAAAVRTVSDEYERLDRDILALLATERGKLQPETIAKVERNLAIIDEAITEIRQALIEDPGNEALRQLLKASYGQKSALVRQVSRS